MTAEQKSELRRLQVEALELSKADLALAWLRYEAVRKLNPEAFKTLVRRNLAGEDFDDLVDALIVGESK